MLEEGQDTDGGGGDHHDKDLDEGGEHHQCEVRLAGGGDHRRVGPGGRWRSCGSGPLKHGKCEHADKTEYKQRRHI